MNVPFKSLKSQLIPSTHALTHKGGRHGLGKAPPRPEEAAHLAQAVAQGAAEVRAQGHLVCWVCGWWWFMLGWVVVVVVSFLSLCCVCQPDRLSYAEGP